MTVERVRYAVALDRSRDDLNVFDLEPLERRSEARREPVDGVGLNHLPPGDHAFDRKLTIVSRDLKFDLELIANAR